MRFVETFPFLDMALPKFGVCQSKDSGTQNLGPLPFGKRMAASAHIPVWGSYSLAIKVRLFSFSLIGTGPTSEVGIATAHDRLEIL